MKYQEGGGRCSSIKLDMTYQGISATWKPMGTVNLASSSRIPREYRISRARIIASGDGEAGQSKPRMLSMPRAFNCHSECKSTVCFNSELQGQRLY